MATSRSSLISVDPAEVAEVKEKLDQINAALDPELIEASWARTLLEEFVAIRRRADFAITALARKVNDAAAVSQAAGVPVGQAKATIDLGRNLKAAPELGAALQSGAVSAEQAREIASAEASAPGVTEELVAVANSEPFHVFKDRAPQDQARGRATQRPGHAPACGPLCSPLLR